MAGNKILDPIELDAEQRSAVDKLVSNKSGGALIAADMGTGKTVIAVEYLKAVSAQTVLLIIPVQTMGEPLTEDSTYEDGWWGTAMRQQLPLDFKRIDSTAPGLKNLADLQWSVPGLYAVGHEMFVRMAWERKLRHDRKGNPKQKWDKKKQEWVPDIVTVNTEVWDVDVDVIIFDEVHRTANGMSRTFKTLDGVGKNHVGAPRAGRDRIGMSGTYEGNSFDGAWAVTKWIWPTRIDDSIFLWRAKWAKVEYDHFKPHNQNVIGELSPGAYVSWLPCYVYIESKLDIEVDDRIFEVELHPEQRKAYDDIEKRMVAWIEDNPLVVKFPTTKRVRLRQVTLGLPTIIETVDKNGAQDFDVEFDLDCLSSKIDAMPKILEEFFDGEPALIFTDSQKFARVVAHRLNKLYGDGTAREWSGKVSRKTRDQDKQDFLNGDYKYFVAVIKAVGTGTNGLQYATRNMLYLSDDDSMIDGKQSFKRTHRRGQEKNVRVARLHAVDTIDSGQYSKLMQAALEANKRKRVRK